MLSGLVCMQCRNTFSTHASADESSSCLLRREGNLRFLGTSLYLQFNNYMIWSLFTDFLVQNNVELYIFIQYKCWYIRYKPTYLVELYHIYQQLLFLQLYAPHSGMPCLAMSQMQMHRDLIFMTTEDFLTAGICCAELKHEKLIVLLP